MCVNSNTRQLYDVLNCIKLYCKFPWRDKSSPVSAKQVMTIVLSSHDYSPR